jgi:cobalamin biosynthetic protein CobC
MIGGVTHGGDLGDVQRRYPDAPKPWLDLSTGINPVAYPLPDLPADLWARLPSRAQYDALIAAAAIRYGVKDPATIVAAPGTQALIQLLPRLYPPADVAIVGPTYEEHEVTWRREGAVVRMIDAPDQARDEEILVVVNPDNPTGRLFDLKPRWQTTIVDEAFIDFLPPAASIISRRPSGTIVLRSFGKTYGLGGLRLGFAIANADVAAGLSVRVGPWAVSGPALEIGARALADGDWLDRAARRLSVDSERLDGLLVSAGFSILGGTPLFRLARHDDVPAVVRQLGLAGIHVRAFFLQPDRLRFGLPANDSGFKRLEAALAQFTRGEPR